MERKPPQRSLMCVTEAMFKPVMNVNIALPDTAEITVVNAAISTKVTVSVSSYHVNTSMILAVHIYTAAPIEEVNNAIPFEIRRCHRKPFDLSYKVFFLCIVGLGRYNGHPLILPATALAAD